MIVLIQLPRHLKLVQVTETACGLAIGLGPGKSGQQERSEDGDDGNDDQQFDQREGAAQTAAGRLSTALQKHAETFVHSFGLDAQFYAIKERLHRLLMLYCPRGPPAALVFPALSASMVCCAEWVNSPANAESSG